MNRRRIALLLLLVGLLCLPAPFYLGWAAQAASPPAQTAQIYAAEPLDLSNTSDQKRLVGRHGGDRTIADYQLVGRADTGYRKPNATREVLVTAMREGSASTTDADVQADLRDIDAGNEFVSDTNEYTEPDGYYRFAVTENGSRVTADPVTVGTVANATAERVPHYEDLSPGEQQTVDNVLENSSGEDIGYRPRVNDPYVDQLPTAIWKGDTLYSIHTYGHVDDFGSGFSGFVVGLGVAALGIMFLLVGAGLFAYDRWSG